MSKTCLHIILIGCTEMTEIKYNGDGIYTASPAPSMEDRESLIDPQSPYGSSRLDNFLKRSKVNDLDYLEAEYIQKADCNYILYFFKKKIIVPSRSKLCLIVTVIESFPQLMVRIWQRLLFQVLKVESAVELPKLLRLAAVGMEKHLKLLLW